MAKKAFFPPEVGFFFQSPTTSSIKPKIVKLNGDMHCFDDLFFSPFSLLFPKLVGTPDNSHFLNKDISSTNNFRFGVVDVCPSSPFAWQANDEGSIGSFSNAPRCARYQNTTSGQEQMKEESYRHKS